MRVGGKTNGAEEIRLVMNIDGGKTQQQSGLLNSQSKGEADEKSGQVKVGKGKGEKSQASAKHGVKCRKSL